MFVCFCRPADALPSSEPGGGQGNLATHTVAQDCMFCLLLFTINVILFSLCYALSARNSPPLAGLWVVSPFYFVVVFAFCLAPPTTMVACGRVWTLVSLVFALVFSFSSLFSVSPIPRHAGVTPEALTVVRAATAPFSSRPPRHTGSTRQV